MPTDTPRPARDLINNANAMKNAGITNAPSAQIPPPGRPQDGPEKPQVASGTPPAVSEPSPSIPAAPAAPAAPADPLSLILSKLNGIESRLEKVEAGNLDAPRAPMSEEQRHAARSSMVHDRTNQLAPVGMDEAGDDVVKNAPKTLGFLDKPGAIVDPSRGVRRNVNTVEHGGQIKKMLEGLPAHLTVIPNETKLRMRFGDLWFSFQAGVATTVPLAVAIHMQEKGLIAPLQQQKPTAYLPQKSYR